MNNLNFTKKFYLFHLERNVTIYWCSTNKTIHL